MTGRSRHGLHVVRNLPAPNFDPVAASRSSGRPPFLGLHQQSVALAVAGTLNADTAGRLRMFLAMFTVDGGPRELVLDLLNVIAVDESGMAPIFEADEAMCARMGSLRLSSLSSAISCFLADARLGRMLAAGRPLPSDGAPAAPVRVDDWADDGSLHGED